MSFPGLLAQPALSFPALEVRGLSRILVSHADGSLEVVMRWSPEQDTEQLRLVVFPASGVSAEGYSKQATGSIVVSEVAWAAVTQP